MYNEAMEQPHKLEYLSTDVNAATVRNARKQLVSRIAWVFFVVLMIVVVVGFAYGGIRSVEWSNERQFLMIVFMIAFGWRAWEGVRALPTRIDEEDRVPTNVSHDAGKIYNDTN